MEKPCARGFECVPIPPVTDRRVEPVGSSAVRCGSPVHGPVVRMNVLRTCSRFRSNPAGSGLCGRSAALRRLPIAGRMAAHRALHPIALRPLRGLWEIVNTFKGRSAHQTSPQPVECVGLESPKSHIFCCVLRAAQPDRLRLAHVTGVENPRTVDGGFALARDPRSAWVFRHARGQGCMPSL
jgi:hypothetical protein